MASFNFVYLFCIFVCLFACLVPLSFRVRGPPPDRQTDSPPRAGGGGGRWGDGEMMVCPCLSTAWHRDRDWGDWREEGRREQEKERSQRQQEPELIKRQSSRDKRQELFNPSISIYQSIHHPRAHEHQSQKDHQTLSSPSSSSSLPPVAVTYAITHPHTDPHTVPPSSSTYREYHYHYHTTTTSTNTSSTSPRIQPIPKPIPIPKPKEPAPAQPSAEAEPSPHVHHPSRCCQHPPPLERPQTRQQSVFPPDERPVGQP